jgi:hypothetical protein
VRALGDDLLHAHAVEVSMFCMASIWKMYSLPERRAGSPVQFSRRAEDGEVDVGPLQQLGHRLGDLLVLVVERAGAADPVEVLGLERLARVEDR